MIMITPPVLWEPLAYLLPPPQPPYSQLTSLVEVRYVSHALMDRNHRVYIPCGWEDVVPWLYQLKTEVLVPGNIYLKSSLLQQVPA